MPKITKLSQLDPGIVALIKSDNDQDLILANNMMKALKLELGLELRIELNPAIKVPYPDTNSRYSCWITGGKFEYYIGGYTGEVRRRDNPSYFNDYFKQYIDKFLRNEQETV